MLAIAYFNTLLRVVVYIIRIHFIDKIQYVSRLKLQGHDYPVYSLTVDEWSLTFPSCFSDLREV